MTSTNTCTSSHAHAIAGLLTVLASGLSACSLFSIDPDEIDVANGDTTSDAGDDADEVGGSETTDQASGTGEFESTDATGASEADTGSDGQASSDSGTTSDPALCEAGDEVVVGDNPVSVEVGVSNFEGSCGGSENEALVSFSPAVNGDYQFSLASAEFSAVLYLVDEFCVEIAESCSNNGDPLVRSMLAGDTVLVMVDSDGGVGSATLTITGP